MEEYAKQIDKKAQEKDTLMGRIIQEQVQDGYAMYLVTGVDSEHIKLIHVPTGYKSKYGEGGWFNRPEVESDITKTDQWNNILDTITQ